MLTTIEEGAVLTPSPLLTFHEPFITLHFQIDGQGRLTSPRVPTSNHRDLAESTVLSPQDLVGRTTVLDQIAAIIDWPTLLARVQAAERELAMAPEPGPSPQVFAGGNGIDGDYKRTQDNWALIEHSKRMSRNAQTAEPAQPATQQTSKDNPVPQTDQGPIAANASPAAVVSDTVQVGAFVPLWAKDRAGADRLFYLRQIDVRDEPHLQGFLVDWPRPRGALLDEVADLMPDADLLPRTLPLNSAGPESTMNLATVPATLKGLPAVAASVTGITPTRLALLIVWAVVLAALGAGGMMLHASLLYGQRRSDFASAVTHELRTPLTTFRLYSEMLADGMVTDPARKHEYLETLRRESSRLARLVENVLACARLEEGRQHTSPQQVRVQSLFDEIMPGLTRQAAEHDMQLHVTSEVASDRTVRADRDSVSRILTNLVDNACKYASDAAERAIDLRLECRDARLLITVRDYGPGIGADAAGKLFTPFQRGKAAGERGATGVGLGLALCRSLARDMGGDLRLASTPRGDYGARFVLQMPLSGSVA